MNDEQFWFSLSLKTNSLIVVTLEDYLRYHVKIVVVLQTLSLCLYHEVGWEGEDDGEDDGGESEVEIGVPGV